MNKLIIEKLESLEAELLLLNYKLDSKLIFLMASEVNRIIDLVIKEK